MADEKSIDTIALTELEMLRLDRDASLQRALNAEINLLLRERMELLARIDPHGALKQIDAEIQKRKLEIPTVRQRAAAVTSAIEARLGLNLAECSFDDVTGTIHHLGPATGNEG